MDELSNLPVELFVETITYLPFSEVISVCNVNKKTHNYCTDNKYNAHWKRLIDYTFGSVYGYETMVEDIQRQLGLIGTYNYLIYVNLVKKLDHITQLMIYYRQNDMDNFNDPKFTKTQKFLALFLLNDINNIEKYLPDKYYLKFINIMKGNKVSKKDINNMLAIMAINGNVLGIKYFQKLGGDIHFGQEHALRFASIRGHLNAVKYLVENGANIHAEKEYALKMASNEGHIDIVKYLVENGADIHAGNEESLKLAAEEGHIDVVKFLIENGANIHANNDKALKVAVGNNHKDVVKFLIENRANIIIGYNKAVKDENMDMINYFRSVSSKK